MSKNDRYKFLCDLKDNRIEKIYPDRIINSLYFDNLEFQIFNDSEEGLTPRKIRVRNYPNDLKKLFYKEMKISSNEGRFKLSKIINKRQYLRIIKNGIFDNLYGNVYPVLEVSYLSYYKFKTSRITIDREIQYTKFNKQKKFKELMNVVEIKNNSNEETRLIDEIIHNPRFRFSKYCNAFKKLF